jgi:hypothetical protein
MISLLHRMYAQEEEFREHDTDMSEHIQKLSLRGMGHHSKPSNKKRMKDESGRFHLLSSFAKTLEPLYLTVINTLIMSQDRSFVRYMFALPFVNGGGGGPGAGKLKLE